MGDVLQGALAYKFAWLLMRWLCQVTWKTTLYLHLQKIYRHDTRRGADIQWEASIFKAMWHFDHMRSGDKYFHYQKTYFSTQTLKTSMTSCSLFLSYHLGSKMSTLQIFAEIWKFIFKLKKCNLFSQICAVYLCNLGLYVLTVCKTRAAENGFLSFLAISFFSHFNINE